MIIEVDFRNKIANSRTFTVKKPPNESVGCPHNHIEVNSHDRTLQCMQCKQLLNPFDYALSLATTESRLFDDINRLNKQKKLLLKEIVYLKSRVKSLKTTQRNKKPEQLKGTTDVKAAIAGIKDILKPQPGEA